MKSIELKAEERAFLNYVTGRVVETRAGEVGLSQGENGAIIPPTIASKIIQKLHDISPLYQLSDQYSVSGEIHIPYYDESSQELVVSYAEEFEELESTSGKLLTVKLDGFLSGVLTKVSKSLFYNSQFNIIEFVVNAMAKSIHKWLEKELINSTPNKIAGLTTVTQKITADSATAVTADELIELQEMIIDDYQLNAVWIMNRETRKAIRKLKDFQGRYLLVPDLNARWGYTLLGREVYTTASMSKMTAGATVIYYGDFSGLAVQFPEKIEVNVLTEKYLDQHAIGVISWIEVDSKVEDTSKIVKLEMASA